MREHYGIEVPPSMIQRVTKKLAKMIGKWKPKETKEKACLLIAEMDGEMVPIVEIGDKVKGGDLRKTRKVLWKEAKLCFALMNGKASRIYAAIIGSPEETGAKIYECAKRTGFLEKTLVHALGDGGQ